MFPKPLHLPPIDPLAATWLAVGDPTRRAILDLLRVRPHTTGELAAAFPLSRFAVMKHLAVLAEVGLVIARRDGRERWNSLNVAPLHLLHDRWVRPYEAIWSKSLAGFKTTAESIPVEASMQQIPQVPNNAGVVTVRLEISIKALRTRVWQLLIDDVRSWWPKDFHAYGAQSRMRFDASVGGCLIEEGDDGGGILWYTVIALNPGHSIDLAGHLAVAFGGPAQTLLRLELRESGTATILALTDAVVGNVSDRSSAALEQGWREVFERGLKAHVEASS